MERLQLTKGFYDETFAFPELRRRRNGDSGWHL
jgi:hypothetical protein